MSNQQDEITTLLKQIEAQDQLINKLQQEQQKLSAYIQQFKLAIDQRTNKEASMPHKNIIDQQKIEKQLQKQLENAKTILKNYQNELKALQKRSLKTKFSSDDLIQLETNVRKKEAQIKELNEDIKNLGIVKRKQEKLIDKKQKNQDGIKLSKLVQQIRKQKQQLEILQSKHKQKKEVLEKRKIAVEQFQKQYIEKCKKYGQKPLNFEEFKQKRWQKKRQQSVKKVENQQKKDPKKYLSIKDIVNSHLDIDSIEISEKGLNELKQKKIVAQNSLKIARKKYEKEIQQLQERIESLKGESENMNKKYLQKKKEKQLTQTSRTMDFKKNSSKTMRKLDPIK